MAQRRPTGLPHAWILAAALLAAAGLPAFAQTAAAPAAQVTAEPGGKQDPNAQLIALADELLEHFKRTSSQVRFELGLPIVHFDRVDLAAAQEQAGLAKEMLAKLDRIPQDGLDTEHRLFAGMLRHALQSTQRLEESYWLTFGVTPYSGGFPIQAAHLMVGAQPVTSAEQRMAYLALIDDYARLLDQTRERTVAQAENGIRVPRPALAGVLATQERMAASAPAALRVAEARLAGVAPEEARAFQAEIERRLHDKVGPAYARIVATFDDAYREKAPAAVGVGQYPGGKEAYRHWIAEGTGLDLDPADIHARGLQAIADIEARMDKLLQQVGFKGKRQDLKAYSRSEPRFVAKTPADVEARFLQNLARIEPKVPSFFSVLPKAPYGVKRLPEAAEAGMTFGYYSPPSPADPKGYYRYNGSKLDERSLISNAHLIFHELIPGHHFQIALEQEMQAIHPIKRFLHYGAFIEGWAEYAASLGEEMGAMDDPWDRIGLLVAQSFIANRLVIDTGMNYLGWSLEQGREYMREHTYQSEAEIQTETLRYSTDMPAQALGYRLGYEKFWELRRRAEKELGPRFDIRAFHAAALGSGSMPLDLLEQRIERLIAEGSAKR
jgi:uncharacterized protein (DUF885 family)